jgi:hypothetical protein
MLAFPLIGLLVILAPAIVALMCEPTRRRIDFLTAK